MATDDLLKARDVTAPATAGQWFLLFPRDGNRAGAMIQNLSAGDLFVVPADVQPANGKAPGDFKIIAAGGLYEFPWSPLRAYWARASVASVVFSVLTW